MSACCYKYPNCECHKPLHERTETKVSKEIDFAFIPELKEAEAAKYEYKSDNRKKFRKAITNFTPPKKKRK